MHTLERFLLPRPGLDCGVDCVLMLQARLKTLKPLFGAPGRMPHDLAKRLPFGLCEASDSDPAILALGPVCSMRRRLLVWRAVAIAIPHHTVRRPVQHRNAG